jgi:hypothetical protein
MKNKKGNLKFYNFKLFILLLNISIFGIFFLLPKEVALAQVEAEKLIKLTNEERLANFLPPLEINDKLSQAAGNKCQDLIEKNYFAHTSPSGKLFWQWIKETGYNYLYAGENLAIDFSDNNEVIKAWLVSPTHRANILNPKFTQIGLAAKKGILNGKLTTIIAQEFGTLVPQSTEISEQSINNNTSSLAEIYSFALPNLLSYQKVDFFFATNNRRSSSIVTLARPEFSKENLNWQVIFNLDKDNQLVCDKNYQKNSLAISTLENKKDVLGVSLFKTSTPSGKKALKEKEYLDRFFVLLILLMGSITANLLFLTATFQLKNKSSKIPMTNL